MPDGLHTLAPRCREREPSTSSASERRRCIILPLAFEIDKLRGRNLFVKDDNPVSQLFFQSIIGIGLMFLLIIGAAEAAGDPNIMVLGVAILAGVIWIPYG